MAFPHSLLLTALGAGLASAVLYASPLGGTSLAAPLLALSSLPLVIVALGWGSFAGAVAAIAAALVTGIALGWVPGALHLVLTGLPTLVLSHMIGLSRPAPDAAGSGVEWYPLGRVLVGAAIAAALQTILVGWVIAYDADALAGEFARLLLAGTPTASIEPALRTEVEDLARRVLRLMPILYPMVWTAVIVFNLWLGAKVVRKSDRLARPWEDLARIEVPRGSGLFYLGSIACGFLPGTPGLLAAPFEGALTTVYMLVGFGVLHVVTRGMAGRRALLAILYLVVTIFLFPGFLVAVLGLAEGVLRLRARRPPGPPRLPG